MIGADAAGRPCWVDIEELAGGGDGPHMAVIGASRFGRCRAIELMVESMAARPPRRGVEVLTTQGEVGQVNHMIEERTRTLLQYGARDFAELRRPGAGGQRDLGEDDPAVVVVVDIDDHLIGGFPPVPTREGYVAPAGFEETVSMLNRLLRQGRSLDLHAVLNVRQMEGPWLSALSGLMSSILEVNADGMSATWRTHGGSPVDVVLPAKVAGGKGS
ncbi:MULTISPECIES: hypothetical protein [Mycobacteriaceae]|uniref:hypothetical protein n=1 Tax=Mycobacteriaceae TaxID=1762 RepID=UPI000F788E48|nr:hypothetical protein [Mycolicibacterium grossiae]